MIFVQGYGAIGSAAASKADGWGFESLYPCHFLSVPCRFPHVGEVAVINQQDSIMTTEAKPSVFQRVQIFYQEIQAEMQKVSWPTREDVKSSTASVALLLVIMSAIIFGMDRIFATVVWLLLSLSS